MNCNYFINQSLRILFFIRSSFIYYPIIKILLIDYWFYIGKFVGIISNISSTPYNEYITYSSLQNNKPLILIILKFSSHNIYPILIFHYY